jgi:hypothetical protein
VRDTKGSYGGMVDILPALKVPRQCPFVLLTNVGYIEK